MESSAPVVRHSYKPQVSHKARDLRFLRKTFVALVICSSVASAQMAHGQGRFGQSGTEQARIESTISQFKTWARHRAYIKQQLDLGQHQVLAAAYYHRLVVDPEPEYAAGLATCYRRLYLLWYAKLSTTEIPDRYLSAVQAFYSSPAGMKSALCAYQGYLVERSIIPPPVTDPDPKKTIRMHVHDSHGDHWEDIMYSDGTEDMKIQRKKYMGLLRRAAKLAPNDPEIRLSMAYESPKSAKRYWDMAKALSEDPSQWNPAGMEAARKAAVELGLNAEARKWKEAIEKWSRDTPDSISKRLALKLWAMNHPKKR